jgi:K+-transporting ATPase KdpF subunit
MSPRATASEEPHPMIIDYALGGIVTVGLLAYLVYALVRPERF